MSDETERVSTQPPEEEPPRTYPLDMKREKPEAADRSTDVPENTRAVPTLGVCLGRGSEEPIQGRTPTNALLRVQHGDFVAYYPAEERKRAKELKRPPQWHIGAYRTDRADDEPADGPDTIMLRGLIATDCVRRGKPKNATGWSFCRYVYNGIRRDTGQESSVTFLKPTGRKSDKKFHSLEPEYNAVHASNIIGRVELEKGGRIRMASLEELRKKVDLEDYGYINAVMTPEPAEKTQAPKPRKKTAKPEAKKRTHGTRTRLRSKSHTQLL